MLRPTRSPRSSFTGSRSRQSFFWRSCSGVACALAILFVGHAASAAAPIPALSADATKPPVNLADYAAVLVVDDASGITLLERNATSVHCAASLTKLMTASVFTSTPTNWNASGKIIKADEVGGGRLRVSSGTVLSLRDVLYSAIIGSANNAAMALARMFDGKGVSSFVGKMNAKAKEIGLAQTAFADPSGMSEKNVVSARDIVTLVHAASRDPETAKAMKIPTYAFTLRSPKAAKTLKNTNELLFTAKDVSVLAGKTGYIEESAYNFVTRVAPKDQPGRSLTVVVLGAPSRLDSQNAALALAQWAWGAYAWPVPKASSPTLPRDLGKGDRGNDVLALQKFLNANGAVITTSGPGSPGKETTFFGEMTRLALVKYQQAHAKHVLAPRGAASATGYLDAVTRAYIQGGASGGAVAVK